MVLSISSTIRFSVPKICRLLLKKKVAYDIIKFDILCANLIGLASMNRWSIMKVCYDKLWCKMNDNEMKKSALAKAANITPYAMTKLNHDRPVTMEVMMNLCKVFHCDIGDLMEVIED
jgi:DNA-binding Xre family transcriptional regulator